MFVSAIEKASRFTRAIHFITRYYGSTDVRPGAATLFFINADGWALTCRHVAAELTGADRLLARFTDFKNKRVQFRGHKKEKHLLKELERQFSVAPNTPAEVYWRVVDCIEGQLQANVVPHATLDIALIHFQGYKRLLCTEFPVFAEKDADLKQGRYLCRLGFPFPEFTNFTYEVASDQITWTNAGRLGTPRFPIEGMVARQLVDWIGRVKTQPGIYPDRLICDDMAQENADKLFYHLPVAVSSVTLKAPYIKQTE